MSSNEHAKQESTAGIEHIDGLYGYAFVLTQNRTVVEDLVQETTFAQFERWGDCGMIALHVFIDQAKSPFIRLHINALRCFVPLSDFVQPDVAENREQPALHIESHDAYVGKLERRQVRAAIQQLPEEAREVILLREWEELSYREIATVLDCPVGTVMSRLARARSKLRDFLLPNNYPSGE